MVSELFEKLINNRTVDEFEKCGPSSDFQYGFRSSRTTIYFLKLYLIELLRLLTGMELSEL